MTQTALDPAPINTRPGALIIPKGSPPPRVRLMEYDGETLIESEIERPDELRPYVDTHRTTWVDIQGLGDEDQLKEIGEIFGIHRLVLADAVNAPQRAKVEAHSDLLVMVIRAPQYPFASGDAVPQVCILLADGYVITFQDRHFGFFEDVRARIRDPQSRIRSVGPAFLAHALIDALVDQYYPVVEEIADGLDEVEVQLVDQLSPELVMLLHGLQRQITTLRRVSRPLVEALTKLSHSDSRLLPADTEPYLRDAQDHAQQILGRLDSCRDVANDTMNAVLATLGHRQNEVMKVLTLVGSIFIPLTFIAGIYGMNFEHMPELKARVAYPIVLSLMAVIAIGMIGLFRWKGWIGGGTRAKEPPRSARDRDDVREAGRKPGE